MIYSKCFGKVAEWLKAPVSKTGMGESPSGVRISPFPPILNEVKNCGKEQCVALRGRFEQICGLRAEHGLSQIWRLEFFRATARKNRRRNSPLFRRQNCLAILARKRRKPCYGFRGDSNGAAKNFQQKILRAGAQTNFLRRQKI